MDPFQPADHDPSTMDALNEAMSHALKVVERNRILRLVLVGICFSVASMFCAYIGFYKYNSALLFGTSELFYRARDYIGLMIVGVPILILFGFAARSGHRPEYFKELLWPAGLKILKGSALSPKKGISKGLLADFCPEADQSQGTGLLQGPLGSWRYQIAETTLNGKEISRRDSKGQISKYRHTLFKGTIIAINGRTKTSGKIYIGPGKNFLEKVSDAKKLGARFQNWNNLETGDPVLDQNYEVRSATVERAESFFSAATIAEIKSCYDSIARNIEFIIGPNEIIIAMPGYHLANPRLLTAVSAKNLASDIARIELILNHMEQLRTCIAAVKLAA